MLLAIPKWILKGIMLGMSVVLGGFLIQMLGKSFIAAGKGLGFPGTALLVVFMGGLWLACYKQGDWIFNGSLIVVMLGMHMLMWGIGFYRR